MSVATGSGKPYWSTWVAEPVNQVITTLVSVTVATSRSMTSRLLVDAEAGVAAVAALTAVAAPPATSGVAAARLPHSRA